jgi:hypothetical protein
LWELVGKEGKKEENMSGSHDIEVEGISMTLETKLKKMYHAGALQDVDWLEK